jgi:hypothetical protein
VASAKDFVDSIRRTQYLIDVDLPPEYAEGAQNILGTLNRTLKLLSEDLYSKDTHFALELVQNADDNTYPCGSLPEIAFTVAPTEIVVENNESGFTPANVRALCDAGKSTKSRHQGYIGEKGIGFKSVFAVSQRPEIHSNGFHFRFDASEDNLLGYVVPEWIAGCTDEPGTKIVLPAKSAQDFSAAALAEISPTLLLFLRKLRRLRLLDTQGATEQLAERQDDLPYVRLTQSITVCGRLTPPQVSRYLLIGHTFSTVAIRDDKRPGAVDTQVDLAFPVDAHGAALAGDTQPVFAFLPIRDCGFTFLVQGDFLLSSSREDIHRDRPWNILIRDQIAEVFISALPRFRESSALAPSFLAYVPDPKDFTDEFFRIAAEQIVGRLKDCECVLARSAVWRRPNQILFADLGFREIFTAEDLWDTLELEYASDDLPTGLKSVALRLGASEPTFPQLFRLLENCDHLSARSAEWFAKLYRYLASRLSRDALVKQARALALIRLEGGAVTTIEQGAVFFPLTRKRRYGFEDELRLVDEAVLAGSESELSEMQRCLRTLGVKEASPASLIRDHILPRHAKSDWKQSDFSALTGHVRYINDHLEEFLSSAAAAGQTRDQALEQLRTGLYIRTVKEADGLVYFGRPKTLYLSDTYLPEVRVQELLGVAADPSNFVSQHYLPEAARSANDVRREEALAQLRTFLYAIGINRLPIVRADSFTDDYEAGPELAKLLNAPETLRAAIRLIDRYWSSYYQSYASVGVYASCSTFVRALSEMRVPTTRGQSVRLCETYLNSEHVRAVFGQSAHYLDIALGNTQFMDAVGITHQVDAAGCFKRLDQLRETQRVSARDVRAVYRALESLSTRMESAIQAGFEDKPRIYIPSTHTWLATGEVVWESHGEFIDALYPPLRHPYAEHRTFFCETLCVALHPSEDALISALESIPERVTSAERQQQESFQIYRRLCVAMHGHSQADPTDKPQWLQRLKTERLFLDHASRLVGAEEDLFVNDDPNLADSFRMHSQISFLEVERSRISIIEPLLEACGIPRLSAAISYDLHEVVDPLLNRDLSWRIQGRRAAIMRLVFHRAHRTFEEAKKAGRWLTLLRLVVADVANLSVTAKLLDYSATRQWDIFRHDEMIYIQRDARSPRDKVCLALCALLGLRTDWADSIYRILFASTDEEVEDFLQVKGAVAIPQDDIDPGPPTLVDSPRSEDANEESGENFAVGTWRDQNAVSPGGVFTSLGGTATSPAPLSGTSSGGAPASSDGRSLSGSNYTETAQPASTSWGSLPRSRERTGRLLSYAEPHSDETTTSPEFEQDSAAERRRISDAAVALVLEREHAEGHQVREMDFANEGFDILRTLPDEADEYVEVKGLAGRWTEVGVALTPSELRYAERYRSRYFLYVVEFATDPVRRTLYRIRDPFGKTLQFRYDSGWKGVSTTLDITEPAVGMCIDLPSGTAHIQEVHRRGQFFSLTVQTAQGERLTTLFVPGKMRLHRE